MDRYLKLDRPTRFARFQDFAESLASFHIPILYWTNGFYFHPHARESSKNNGRRGKQDPAAAVGAIYHKGDYHRYMGVDTNDRTVKVADDFKKAEFQPTDWVITAFKSTPEDLGEIESLAYEAILKREREFSRKSRRR